MWGKWFQVANVEPMPTPKGCRPYFDSSAPHIRTHSRQRLVLWNKAKPKVTHLSRRNKATSASHRRPSHSLSSIQCCGATKYSRTHYNQWCCLHWIGHNKSLTVNCCRVLFMTYWQIYNDFQWSLCHVQCRQTSGCGTARRPVYTWCKPSFVPQMFSSLVFLSAISIFLSSLGLANVQHVHGVLSPPESGSWVDPPLTADWLQVFDSVF